MDCEAGKGIERREGADFRAPLYLGIVLTEFLLIAVGKALETAATPPERLLDKHRPQWARPTMGPRGSAMDQYWDLGMREYLDRLAAEHDCGDAAAAVRGHHDEVTAL
jgi:hypothetical protein